MCTGFHRGRSVRWPPTRNRTATTSAPTTPSGSPRPAAGRWCGLAPFEPAAALLDDLLALADAVREAARPLPDDVTARVTPRPSSPRSRSAAAATSACCATPARSAHPSLSPVVPNGHDQFDNGFRIDRLGLGRSIPQTAYRARGVASAIRSMLDDAGLRARCRDYSRRIDSDVALTRACELIESLARPNGGKRFV